MPDPIHYDPFEASIRRNPHPIYKRLRDEAPAYFIEKYQVLSYTSTSHIETRSAFTNRAHAW